MAIFSNSVKLSHNALNNFSEIIQPELERIDSLNDLTLKIQSYMNFLSQTLSSQGSFKGQCESLLKERIYAFAKSHSAHALAATVGPEIKNDPAMASTLDKIKYLVKARFCHIKNTKFIHHLKMEFAYNRDNAIAHTAAGITLITASYSGLLTSQSDQGKGGWALFSVGAALTIFPFYNALRLSFCDEP